MFGLSTDVAEWPGVSIFRVKQSVSPYTARLEFLTTALQKILFGCGVASLDE